MWKEDGLGGRELSQGAASRNGSGERWQMEQALPGKGWNEVRSMKYGAGVSVAHLALCKEGGLVNRSCVALASRGNSLRRGVWSERQPRVFTGCLAQISACFFYDARFLQLGLSELAVVGFPQRNASAQQC